MMNNVIHYDKHIKWNTHYASLYKDLWTHELQAMRHDHLEWITHNIL